MVHGPINVYETNIKREMLIEFYLHLDLWENFIDEKL